MGGALCPDLRRRGNERRGVKPLPPYSLRKLWRRQEKKLPARALSWHLPAYLQEQVSPSASVRDGDFKLIGFLEDDHVELYDIGGGDARPYLGTLESGGLATTSSLFGRRAQ